MAIGGNLDWFAERVDGLDEYDRVLNRDGIVSIGLILYHGGRDGCSSSFRGPVDEVVLSAQVLVAGRFGHGAGLCVDYSAQAA